MNKKTPEGYATASIADFLALQERTAQAYWFMVRNVRLFKNGKGRVFARKKGGPLDKDGISDICGCYFARFVGFEVKADKGKQRESQIEFQKGRDRLRHLP